MRISLRIPREPLRSAVAGLLTHAGHDVAGADDAAGAALEIVLGAAPVPPSPGRATLVLRPTDRRAESTGGDPAEALRAALATGGAAEWPSPLDPRRLLAALAEPGTAPAAAPPGPAAAEPLRHAPDAWFLLDPQSGAVAWTNAAAAARATSGKAGGRWPPVTDGMRRLPAGHERLEAEGRSWLALWWTVGGGLRCVGVLPLPGAGAAENVKALAEIGRATTTFAHELRNPLASLAGALDLLSGEMLPPERGEVSALGRARLLQMRRLLDDTLRFARPLQGRAEPLDVLPLVESAVAALRLDPQWRTIAFHVESATSLPRALGHEQSVHQALTNLLLNAAEAQPSGGSVTVRLAREGAFLVLRVTDEGPGIPPARREQVFGAFWTSKAHGTGLGLPFVRRVAEAVGGRAVVEDGGRGATLRVDLPVAP